MNYKYCPYCKEELDKNNYVYSCKNGHEIYINPAPCVSVIPIKDNKILLTKRGIDPYKGTIDFIGGFVQVGETIEEAAIRETLEETGLKIKLDKFLGEYDEVYTEGTTYPHCFTYLAQIVGGVEKAMDDVSELFWVDIKNIDKLDLSNGFKGLKKMLEKAANIL